MKKKIISLLLAMVIIVLGAAALLGGCTKNKILVVAPDGAPAFAMAQLFKDKPQFKGAEVEYRVVSSDELSGLMTTGSADIAILPTNLGANLYNKGEAIKVVGATTFGVMYIVSKDPTVQSLQDLQGKKIVSIGKGNVPDFVLQYVLSQNNIQAEIEFRTDGTEIISGLIANTIQIGVLAEPAATGAVGKASAKIIIDLQAEWEKLTGEKGYPQSALFARAKIVSEHMDILNEITTKLKSSATWVAENVAAANEAVTAAGGKVTLPNAAVVSRCNFGFTASADGRESLQNYFKKMLDFNEKLIGGRLPDDGFYL